MRALVAALLVVLLLGLPALSRPRHVGPYSSLGDARHPMGSLGGFPGMAGGTGNDATLAALYALTNLPIYGAGATYYISCDAGGDYPLGDVGNNGLTTGAAFAQWSSVEAVFVAGINVRFDALDTCFTFATANQIDFNSAVAPGGKTVLLRVDSSRVGTRALVTQTSAASIGMIHFADAVDAPNEAGGRVVIQDLELASFTTSGFVVDDGVDLLALNLKSTAADGSRESSARGVMDSHFVCLNCQTTSYNDAAIDVSEGASQTYIGQADITMSTPAAGTVAIALVQGGNGIDPSFQASVASLTVIGHSLLIPAAATGVRPVVRMSPSSAYGSRVATARTLIAGGGTTLGTCFQWVETDVRLVQFSLFQNTLINCKNVLSGAFTTYVAAIQAASSKGIKWSIIDGGTGLGRMIDLNYGGSVEAGTWDATDDILNLRGGAVTFYEIYRRPGASPSPTTQSGVSIAEWRSDLAADGLVNQTAMAGAFATNITANSTLQVADADSNTGGACQVGQACKSPPGGNSYTVPLYAPIWAEALPGATADLANLTLSVTQYGAR